MTEYTNSTTDCRF